MRLNGGHAILVISAASICSASISAASIPGTDLAFDSPGLASG